MRANPTRRRDVHERVSHGTKAAAQIARELLSAERGDRLQNPVVRPAVVFVEQLNVIFIHGEAWLTLFVWGTLPCLAYSARPEMWHFWHLGDCPRDDALGKNPLRRVTR